MPTYANGPAPVTPIAGGGYSTDGANPLEPTLVPQPTPIAYTTTATITVAELLTALLTVTNAGSITITLPTAALIDATLSNAQQNDSFDFSIVNLGAGTWTLAGGTGVTTVGGMTVTSTQGSVRFRLRKTNAAGAASAWSVYRLA